MAAQLQNKQHFFPPSTETLDCHGFPPPKKKPGAPLSATHNCPQLRQPTVGPQLKNHNTRHVVQSPTTTKNNPSHLLRHLLLSPLPTVPVPPPYPAVVELVQRLGAEEGGGVARGAEGRGRSQARDDAVGGAESGKRGIKFDAK